MKKFLRRLIGILAILLAVFLVVLLGLILTKDSWMKTITERGIEEETGLRAEIGEFKTALGSGALRLRGVKLYNSAEFGGAMMALIPELALDLDLGKATQGRLHFRDLRFNLTELNVVRNAAGRLNLEGVEKTIRERLHKRRRKKGEKFEFEFAGIDQMRLTLGNVFYTHLKHPNRRRTLDLAVKNETVSGLKTEEDLQQWAGAMMFRILLQVALTHKDQAPSTEPHLPPESPLAGATNAAPVSTPAPPPHL